MSGVIHRPALSLKEFMVRQKVLKLYRDIWRTTKEIPDPNDRKQLQEWAHSDFKANKHHTDEVTIKMMIQYGERCLKELKQSLELSQGK